MYCTNLKFCQLAEEVLVGCYERTQHTEVVVGVHQWDVLGVHQVGQHRRGRARGSDRAVHQDLETSNGKRKRKWTK